MVVFSITYFSLGRTFFLRLILISMGLKTKNRDGEYTDIWASLVTADLWLITAARADKFERPYTIW